MNNLPFGNILWAVLLSLSGLFLSLRGSAQVCADPMNYVYGLTANGGIYPINVNSATVGSAVNSSSPAASSANAMGYNGSNGKFYYFLRQYPNQVFVSYDPSTNTYVTLAAPSNLTASVVTGCINQDGTGYYCLDINANLFYYNIASNSWTKITSSFTNQSGTSITNTMKSLPSGDMAFDGNGNLWFVISSMDKYGLYEYTAPIATSSVSSVSMQQVIAPTRSTPDGNIIAGIAFNATGQIYLSTTGNRLYIVNNDLTTTLKGMFNVSGVGNDLTSCNYPLAVLATSFTAFTHTLNNNDVTLTWSVSQLQNQHQFFIEHSSDGIRWSTIDFVEIPENSITNKYSYRRNNEIDNVHYYRVYFLAGDGEKVYSPVEKIVITESGNLLQLWPNPVHSFVQIKNIHNVKRQARIYNSQGLFLKELILNPGTNKIDVNGLPTGAYSVRLQHEEKFISLKFIKQ